MKRQHCAVRTQLDLLGRRFAQRQLRAVAQNAEDDRRQRVTALEHHHQATTEVDQAQVDDAAGAQSRLRHRLTARQYQRSATVLQQPEQFAELNTSVADTVLRIVALLLGGALCIGAVGLSATLALGVVERTTELSRLRAIGASRHQVRGLVTLEAILVCIGSAAIALPAGALLGWLGLGLAPTDLAATRVVPWRLLFEVGVGAVVLGGLVALGPARRAAHLSPVLAAKQ